MIRCRIAPTPSGYLHEGNAFNFLLASNIAQRCNGSLRLRIDDLDAPRMRMDYLTDIFESLDWLGINWDKGPRTAEEHLIRYSQQLRKDRYAQFLNTSVATGNVFACTCSRREIENGSDNGQYPGTCLYKRIAWDTPGTSLRIITPDPCPVTFTDRIMGAVTVDLYQTMRHFIIRRRDGIPAYHQASLADDVDFGINCLVRGADLLHSTAAQLYLAEVTGNRIFSSASFYHHPLILAKNGVKLSKSSGSCSLKHQREEGINPATIHAGALKWMSGFLD